MKLSLACLDLTKSVHSDVVLMEYTPAAKPVPSSVFVPVIYGTFTNLPCARASELKSWIVSLSSAVVVTKVAEVALIMLLRVSNGTVLRHAKLSVAFPQPAWAVRLSYCSWVSWKFASRNLLVRTGDEVSKFLTSVVAILSYD